MQPRSLNCSTRAHLCAVAPSPELREKIQRQLTSLRERTAELSALTQSLSFRFPVRAGMNDGIVRPTETLFTGIAAETIRSAPAARVPLRGELRVAVIMVNFADKKCKTSKQHISDLFFSSGKIPSGSVKEYYQDVTKNMVDIIGEVVGPIELKHNMSYYANGQSGLSDNSPNAQTMAEEAAQAADKLLDFTPYDNDEDGYVDAYVIVHAGTGAEQTGNAQDIWSHKWVLANGPYDADATKIYGYLTVPEDCGLGVCAHELGHLLFGFPDLYDADYSSEGIGNWCLMSGGSWNGNGDTPAHPSAWCKRLQNWTPILTVSGHQQVQLEDVKDGGQIIQALPPTGSKSEYFLIENRQQAGFDSELPSGGLLIWHIDDSIAENTNEQHLKVALLQADGKRDLERATNRGDAGDPFPGSQNVFSINGATTPNTRLYSGADSHLAISNISGPGKVMTFELDLRPRAKKPKRRGKAA